MARVGVVSDLLLAFERKSLDYRMASYRGEILARGAAPSQIVIIAVDESSLDRLGRFTLWPRAYHTRLLERLGAAGARTVAFDILFAEPDVLPPEIRAVRAGEAASRSQADSATVDRILEDVGGDPAFTRALSEFGSALLATDPLSGASPLPELATAAAGVGHVSMAPDPDGILRRVQISPAPTSPPPLGVIAAERFRAHEGEDLLLPRLEGELILDFIGPRGSFLTLPFADVMEGRVDERLLSGKLVFVGATASGLGDVFATPYSEDTPGVEAHATLALQLLEGRSIRSAGGWGRGLPLLLAVPVALALLALGPLWAGVVSVALAGAYMVVVFEAFAQGGIQMPFGSALLAWMATALVTGVYRFGLEERGRREIRRAFSRYVAPEVVDEIAEKPELLRVGGESREITVGFVDIRGFTTISESMEPPELARFLHAFFTVVEEEIHARRGTVDKYIGDAVMMVFGAPNPLPDAPERACDAALGIRDAVASRKDLWTELGVEDLRIGVGLETGPAVVGNIGSERRFDYTALGDTVNVASRLQDLNKELKSAILVGEGTFGPARDHFSFEDRGEHTLRGRPGPMNVYELLDRKAHQTPGAGSNE